LNEQNPHADVANCVFSQVQHALLSTNFSKLSIRNNLIPSFNSSIMMNSTSSEMARKRGNDEFRKAFGEPPASNFVEMRVGHAEKAQRLYLKAAKRASENNSVVDKLSAEKNMGVVALKLASLDGYQSGRTKELVLYQFREALSHLSECLFEGKATQMKSEWLEDMASKIKDCVDAALVFVVNIFPITDDRSCLARCSELQKLISTPQKQMFASAFIQCLVADEIVKAAIGKPCLI
jgi:hypothetical protein